MGNNLHNLSHSDKRLAEMDNPYHIKSRHCIPLLDLCCYCPDFNKKQRNYIFNQRKSKTPVLINRLILCISIIFEDQIIRIIEQPAL